MATRIRRREFLVGSLAALASPGCLSPRMLGSLTQIVDRPLPFDQQPRIACIGLGGRGWVDAQRIAAAGGRVTALCDVDITPPTWVFLMNDVIEQFPEARFHRDYREMLANHADDFDAVVISTPDHHHCHAAALAMRAGKHVYCQKPLAWSIEETRQLTELARETGVVTQMGNQAHATDHLRRTVELVRGGVVGRVQQIHCLTDRPIWPQGMKERPAPRPVPEDLDWDLWLGPAPERPYAEGYHSFNWRGWWDFGTGALGDMGCHILDMPFWALDTGTPTRLSASSDGTTEDAAPNASTVSMRLPAGAYSEELDLHWYDGGRLPPAEIAEAVGFDERKLRDFDCIVLGTDGAIAFNHLGKLELHADAKSEALRDVPQSIPRVLNDAVEWIDGINGGSPPLSRFEISGPFNETVMAGNLAIRVGRTMSWDAAAMRSPDTPEASQYLGRTPRPGWGSR